MHCTRTFSQRDNLLTHVRIAHQLCEADADAAISRAESMRRQLEQVHHTHHTDDDDDDNNNSSSSNSSNSLTTTTTSKECGIMARNDNNNGHRSMPRRVTKG